MLKNLDVFFGILAWLCALPMLSGPYIFVALLDKIYYLPGAWALCVCSMFLFRKHSWGHLLWVFLSALMFVMLLPKALLVMLLITALLTAGLSLDWRSVFSRNNIDYLCAIIAWACGLAVFYSFAEPAITRDYATIYLPVAWVVCIVGLLVFKKHPWKDLWWVFLSAPLVWWYWLGMIFMLHYMLLYYRP